MLHPTMLASFEQTLKNQVLTTGYSSVGIFPRNTDHLKL